MGNYSYENVFRKRYGPRRVALVRYLLDLCCVSVLCLTSSGTISIHEKRLQISEIVFKSLARFTPVYTQFRVNESLDLYLLNKLRSFGDKPLNSLATETTLTAFSGACRRVRLAKLTRCNNDTNLVPKSMHVS